MGSIRGGTARRKGARDRMLGRYTRGIVSAAPTAIVVTEAQIPWEMPISSWVAWCVPQSRGQEQPCQESQNHHVGTSPAPEGKRSPYH